MGIQDPGTEFSIKSSWVRWSGNTERSERKLAKKPGFKAIFFPADKE